MELAVLCQSHVFLAFVDNETGKLMTFNSHPYQDLQRLFRKTPVHLREQFRTADVSPGCNSSTTTSMVGLGVKGEPRKTEEIARSESSSKRKRTSTSKVSNCQRNPRCRHLRILEDSSEKRKVSTNNGNGKKCATPRPEETTGRRNKAHRFKMIQMTMTKMNTKKRVMTLELGGMTQDDRIHSESGDTPQSAIL